MSKCCEGLDVLLDRSGPAVVVWPDDSVYVGASTGPKKYVVMHIENPKGLVAKEKGEGLAWATDMLVPQFIEDTIYGKVADEMRKQFREKGSEVSVYVTADPPKDGVKTKSDFAGGMVAGVVASGIIYTVLRLTVMRKK